MKCLSFCASETYNLNQLAEYLDNNKIEHQIYDEVIYFKDGEIDSFIFNYGCGVIWGAHREYMHNKIREFENFATNALEAPLIDSTNFKIDDTSDTAILEEEDLIVLEKDDSVTKLSFSNAFAQSVKLMVFEQKANNTIEKTKYLSNELANQGKISLSQKALSKEIGKLFLERSSINLNSDILDTPEFFWRRPSYEPYYLMSRAYMDIDTRLEILNKRLSVIHELYQLLSEELKHIHSSKLELTIVFLIVIEVLLEILKDIIHFI